MSDNQINVGPPLTSTQSAEYVERLDAEVEVARAKARRAGWHALAAALVVVGVMIAGLTFAIVHASDGRDARTLCADRFTNQQRAANLGAFAAQAEIINTVIPAIPPLDPVVVQQKVADLKAEGEQAITTYRTLVIKNTAWTEDGRPLPCPIGP